MRGPIIGRDRRGRPIHPIAGAQEMLNIPPTLVEIPLSGGAATGVTIKPTTPYGNLGWWAGVLVLGGPPTSPGAVVIVKVNGTSVAHIVGVPGTSGEFAVSGSDQVTVDVTGGNASDVLKGSLVGQGSNLPLIATPGPSGAAILSGGTVDATITAGTVVVEQSDPTLLLVGGAGPLLLDAYSLGPIAQGGGVESVEVNMAGYASFYFAFATQAILATPALQISFIWLDGAGNEVIQRDVQDRYNNFISSIEPVLTQSLRIQVTNNNGTHAQSLYVWAVGYQGPVPPGFIGQGQGSIWSDAILGVAHPSIASGTSYSLDLPPWRGPCSVHVGVATTNYNVQVIAYDSTGTEIGVLYSNASPGETLFLSPFYLPGDACSLVYTNAGTSSQNPYLAVVAER